MKIHLKIVGWMLCGTCLFIYSLLWNYESHYFSAKIGSSLALILLLVTNFISPPLYLTWRWIAGSFPLQFLFLWLSALAAASIGILFLVTGDA
jgi:hypothetical protein